jgi:hypothetical protein
MSEDLTRNKNVLPKYQVSSSNVYNMKKFGFFKEVVVAKIVKNWGDRIPEKIRMIKNSFQGIFRDILRTNINVKLRRLPKLVCLEINLSEIVKIIQKNFTSQKYVFEK